VAQAVCWVDVLRSMRYGTKGHNYRTVQRWCVIWGIATDHFDPHAGRKRAGRSRVRALEDVLVEHSTYGRDKLKRRLFASGLKRRECELCGQGELWRGSRMSLILDHVNGVSDDHRLENLRIVCPNCNATLDTHCGRSLPPERACATCGGMFTPRHVRHRYCSPTCWGVEVSKQQRGRPRPATRKVERPSYEQLQRDVGGMSICAVGRKYGVSDNAVRKWLRAYEAQASESGSAFGAEESVVTDAEARTGSAGSRRNQSEM
jgi:hypothetical protein